MSACPLCRQRKGKRSCPAKAAVICSHCCGTKRLVEIDCPPDCVYLAGGHARGWEGNVAERRLDARRLAPRIGGLTEEQRRLFFLALAALPRMRRTRRDLDDRVLLQAVTALRKTVETRERGILYEHQAEDVRAQALLYELKGMFEAKDEEAQRVAPDDRDLLAALEALEACLVETAREGTGETAFLDTAGRVAAQIGAAARERPRSLIVEL